VVVGLIVLLLTVSTVVFSELPESNEEIGDARHSVGTNSRPSEIEKKQRQERCPLPFICSIKDGDGAPRQPHYDPCVCRRR
jgi:hypothetical protein